MSDLAASGCKRAYSNDIPGIFSTVPGLKCVAAASGVIRVSLPY